MLDARLHRWTHKHRHKRRTNRHSPVDGYSSLRTSNPPRRPPHPQSLIAGGIVYAGFAITVGSQTRLLGHVISAAISSVVLDAVTYHLPTQAGALLQYVPSTKSDAAVTLVNGAVTSAGDASSMFSGTSTTFPPDSTTSMAKGAIASFPASGKAGSIFEVTGETFTANPTEILIDGQSLSHGCAALTISATVVSWGAGGLQVGPSTLPLGVSAAVETEQLGLGASIMSALGKGPCEATATAASRTAASANVSTLGFASFMGDGGRSGVGVNFMVTF